MTAVGSSRRGGGSGESNTDSSANADADRGTDRDSSDLPDDSDGSDGDAVGIEAPPVPEADPQHLQHQQDLRSALSRFTTGVAIISCVDAAGGFVGLTANSFSSLSLHPPLVLWSLRESSPSLAAFAGATHFAVNVLAQEQADLSRRFASRGPDRFGAGAWTQGAHGAPVLAGCAAVFQCETVSHQGAGDHRLFIGRVLAFDPSALPPLVFHGGQYHRLGDAM